MDPVKILRRAWDILWSYRALWVFGLILAIAGAGASSSASNNGSRYQYNENNHPSSPPNMEQAFQDFKHELNKLFDQGVPEKHITGEALTAFLWVVGVFVALVLIFGIVVAIARYVSETAVIRMVDEYEGTGTKVTIRQGFRIGWSRTAWRLFLINLIVNLPAILMFLIVISTAFGFYLAVSKGNLTFTAPTLVIVIGLLFLMIFGVVIVSIGLHLLRNFFWRVSALEDVGVSESLRRGFALVRENWKNVGLMWLVMIGLSIAWAFVSIIAAIIMLPAVLVTSLIGAILVAAPGLLLVGLFSLFLSGPLPWIAAALFILPLFFTIAFSPWLLLGSWQTVYTSTVWTLTYRELKALPAIAPEPKVEPVPGD